MRDAFGPARERLACEMDSHSALPIKPIVADPWVISSLLQKSIRRGEIEIAQRAALALVQVKGAAILRVSSFVSSLAADRRPGSRLPGLALLSVKWVLGGEACGHSLP